MKRIYLFALIFAILTGVAVYSFTRELQQSKEGDTIGVVVAVKRIPDRTLVTTDMIEIKELPVLAVNAKAMTDVSNVIGKITNVPIEQDEQVLSSKLSDSDIADAGLAYNIPDGKRAYSIEVTDTSGVAGYIQKGDHVDIVGAITVDNSTTTTKESIPIAKIVLQDIEVLVTSTQTLNEDEEFAGYTIVTLAVTPEQAVKLFYMAVNGRTTLILRNDQDSKILEIPIYHDGAQ